MFVFGDGRGGGNIKLTKAMDVAFYLNKSICCMQRRCSATYVYLFKQNQCFYIIDTLKVCSTCLGNKFSGGGESNHAKGHTKESSELGSFSMISTCSTCWGS